VELAADVSVFGAGEVLRGKLTPGFLRNRRSVALEKRFTNLAHHGEVSDQRIVKVPERFILSVSNGRISRRVRPERKEAVVVASITTG
jgi:hypothetical protein